MTQSLKDSIPLLLLIGLCRLDLNIPALEGAHQVVHFPVERLELIDNLLPLASRIRDLPVSRGYRTRASPLADQDQRLQYDHRNQKLGHLHICFLSELTRVPKRGPHSHHFANGG